MPITQQELLPLIYFSYLGDTDLIDKYQGGDRTFEECVDFNYREIIEHMADKDFEGNIRLYAISLQAGDEVDNIGYCVVAEKPTGPHMLMSFAFNIHYRKSVFLVDWLRKIQSLLGDTYYTALWNKNERAINFFVKNGFQQFDSPDKTFKYLVKSPELINKQNWLWLAQQ